MHEPIAGIVLGAGEFTRFGQPKQLLDWHGQPFVHAVAQNALDAGLSPVLVVTGANAEQVGAAIMDLDVKVVRNDEWKSGQGSSIKAGVLSLIQPPSGLPQIRQQTFLIDNKNSRVGFEMQPSGVLREGAQWAEEGRRSYFSSCRPAADHNFRDSSIG